MPGIPTLPVLRLYFRDDKVLKLRNVKVVKEKGRKISLVGNPFSYTLEYIDGLGIACFDGDGIIGALKVLPRFMYLYLVPRNCRGRSNVLKESTAR